MNLKLNVNVLEKIDSELKKIIRVLKISTKPSFKDFYFILKITIAGIAIMGLIGVIVAFIFSLLDKL